jgi:hypothetical protein
MNVPTHGRGTHWKIRGTHWKARGTHWDVRSPVGAVA